MSMHTSVLLHPIYQRQQGCMSIHTSVLLHPVYQGTAGLCVNAYISPTPPRIPGDSRAVCQCIHQSYSTPYTRGQQGCVSMHTSVLLHPVYQGTAGLCVNAYISPTPPCTPGDSRVVCQSTHQTLLHSIQAK